MSSIDINSLIFSIKEHDFKPIYFFDDEIDMVHFFGKLTRYLNNSHLFYINNDLVWNENNYNTVSKIMIKNSLVNNINNFINTKNYSITFVVPTTNKIVNKIVINILDTHITVCRYI